MPLRNHSRDYSVDNRARVRKLRNEASLGERVLWAELRGDQTGFRFRRQHPCGPYVMDFYCPEAMLCVEVDGDQHVPETDSFRDDALAALRILTYRIRSQETLVPRDLQAHLAEVYRICCVRSGRQPF